MTFSDDDNDVGPVVLTVIVVTLVLGSMMYAYKSSGNLQTASNLPAIERTVPTIVPSQPGL